MKAGTIWREPLLHFFFLGLLLFLLYRLVAGPAGPAAEEIVVDQARLESLVANFEKTWRRAPTEDELQNLVDAWVREEILYREGVAVGFDLNDPVIRRRVAQKMSFVADGMVPENPSDAELQDWLTNNLADYSIPATYSLRQVYIDPQRHADDLDTVLDETLGALQRGADPASLGDSTLLLSEVSSASSNDVARIFGSVFVESLADIAVGEWAGPVRSGYGLHYVKISEYAPPRKPELPDVRAAVERDLLNDKAERINESFYESLRGRYTVRIEAELPDG